MTDGRKEEEEEKKENDLCCFIGLTFTLYLKLKFFYNYILRNIFL